MLDFAGLFLQLPVERWTDEEIATQIPAELQNFLDDGRRTGRLWVYADDGAATTTVNIGPDRLVIYRVSPDRIEPGIDIIIEGDLFLSDGPGSVALRCEGARETQGEITAWTQSVIGVRFFPVMARSVTSQLCDIIVRNQVKQSATTRHPLTVTLDHTDIRYHINPARRYDEHLLQGRLIVGGTLSNGWVARAADMSWSDDGGGNFARVDWRDLGDGRAEITLLCRRGGARRGAGNVAHNYCTADEFPSEVYFELDIEGPAGLPFDEDW